MDRHDALRLAGDRRLDLGGVDTLGFGVAVDQDRGRAGDPDGFRRGKEGIGVGDHFVAFADAQGHQGQPEGVRAVAAGNGILRSGKFGEFLFKLLVHRAVDIFATLDHRLDVGVDFRLDVVVLAHMTVEWNLHSVSPYPSCFVVLSLAGKTYLPNRPDSLFRTSSSKARTCPST